MRPLAFTLALLIPFTLARAGELRVGTAAVPITPAVGTPMAGYYSARLSEGVLDDLYAKAIVVEQDGSKIAIVSCDLIAMPAPVSDEARRLIEKSVGLPPERVMISATHSHTGPILSGSSARDPAAPGADAAKKYAGSLPELIARSVQTADRSLRPARVSVGIGRDDRLAFNRRFVMKDGSIGWNPGKLNPNIVRPTGPTDPDVPVVYFDSPADAEPIATYVNFAMHLDTVGGLRVSADYPYTLGALLARLKGKDMLTLFTIGTAGDINHIDVSSAERQGGPDEAKRIGTVLAGEVLKTYARLKPIASYAPRARREIVSLDLPELKPGELEEARKTAVKFGKDEPGFMQKVQAFKVLDVAARDGKPLDAEVQVIALGDDLAFVALPGEVFVELGLAIKKDSPFKHTIIAELANGTIGYIPTRRAYAEGNYEPISARCAEGSGEKLVEASMRLLKGLKEGPGGGQSSSQ